MVRKQTWRCKRKRCKIHFKWGIFVSTYWSGIVNETHICFLEGVSTGEEPWARVEEIDVIYDGQTIEVEVTEKTHLVE
ncbi:hypothetical protein [Jeotgalibacillus proteolyticus]|uniref:Uncharacterized protein n=1 Tax=Jeotgalibacillus proteolyticus TaxID=2082395 RepID=A0A2S5G9H0_9BACL|nr:hypothetical protein [Jeotgalibacillus proteolyticus]PPA69636.1 hypothetical protein C4B60_13910 [Jeotgalibacillus proteolyticus]